MWQRVDKSTLCRPSGIAQIVRCLNSGRLRWQVSSGKRSGILLVREQDGSRTSSRIDLTTTYWMNNPEYRVMPNDVIVVNPNRAKVKSSGIVGNIGILMSLVTTLLSITVLLTR